MTLMEDNFKRVEEKLEKLADKVENTNDRLNSIDKTVAVYNEQLKIHIEGTIQNRETIRILQDKLESELKPIKSHVSLMNNIAKIVIFVGVLAAIYKNLR